MNSNSLNSLPVDTTTSSSMTSSARQKKRQGKASKARNTTRYRERVNSQMEEKRLSDIATRLKLFEGDDTEPLRNVINTVQITPQKRAVPLSTTTRSIGFATAIFYDRAVTTWSLHALADIASIHQVYRVHLWLAHYKLFLAQQIQVEPISCVALESFYISDEIREVLATVVEVPSVITAVLDSIGKIEFNDKVFHMGYAKPPSDENQLLEYYTICVNPNNLRIILETLANPDVSEGSRNAYLQYNSIPGLNIIGNLLTNADQVYPEIYGVAELRNDVHAYKNFMTRIQSRLPKHNILKYVWNGKGAVSGLWSGARCNARVVSVFKQLTQTSKATCSKMRRDAQGQPIERERTAISPISEYVGCNVTGERCDYWSPEYTPEKMTIIGVASLVGEECFIHSRYELVSHVAVTNTATTLLYTINDAPR